MKKLLFILGVFIAVSAASAVATGTGFVRSMGYLVCGIYMGLGLKRLEQILDDMW